MLLSVLVATSTVANQLCDLQQLDAASPTLSAEFDAARRANQPVVIRKMLEAAPETLRGWKQEYAHLVGIPSGTVANVGIPLHEVDVRLPQGANIFGAFRRRSTVADYLKGAEGDGGGIIFTSTSAQMNDKDEGLLGRIATEMNETLLSVAHSGRGLSLHNHAEAWQALIYGQKRWIMLPPASTATWYRPEHAELIARAVMLPPQNLSHDTAMMAQLQEWGAQQCTLESTDLIYIPCNWHHATLATVPETVAIGGQATVGANASAGASCRQDIFGQASTKVRRAARASRKGQWSKARKQVRKGCQLNPLHYQCPILKAQAARMQTTASAEAKNSAVMRHFREAWDRLEGLYADGGGASSIGPIHLCAALTEWAVQLTQNKQLAFVASTSGSGGADDRAGRAERMGLVQQLLARVTALDTKLAFARAHTMAAVMRLAGSMGKGGQSVEVAAAVDHAEKILATWQKERRPASIPGGAASKGNYKYDYDYQQVQASSLAAAIKPEQQLQQVLQMHRRGAGARRKEL
jgi:hypothetical protein